MRSSNDELALEFDRKSYSTRAPWFISAYATKKTSRRDVCPNPRQPRFFNIPHTHYDDKSETKYDHTHIDNDIPYCDSCYKFIPKQHLTREFLSMMTETQLLFVGTRSDITREFIMKYPALQWPANVFASKLTYDDVVFLFRKEYIGNHTMQNYQTLLYHSTIH